MLARGCLRTSTRATATRATMKGAKARTMTMTSKRSVAMKASESDDEGAKRAALAAMVAASVLMTSAVMPEEAEAARSGGRVGGGSFRASSRASPRMSAQSRTAPPLVGGGYGYGYNSVFMPMPIMPMYGFWFVFGGLGFFFNVMLFFFVLNTVLGFVSQLQEGANLRNPYDDDDESDDEFDGWNRRR